MTLMPGTVVRIMGDLEEVKHLSLKRCWYSWRLKWAHTEKMAELRVKDL